MTLMTVEEFMDFHSEVPATVEAVPMKNKLIGEYIEAYYRASNRYPSSYELTILANWILAYELKDKDKTKKEKYEYNIMSKSQKDRRSVEVAMEGEITDILHVKRKNNLSTAYKESRQIDY